MNSKLGRRQGEDEPASACIYRRQAEHVREERTDLVGLRGEHDRMDPGDHAAILAAQPAIMPRRTQLSNRYAAGRTGQLQLSWPRKSANALYAAEARIPGIAKIVNVYALFGLAVGVQCRNRLPWSYR